jgi:hypothetical protein
MLRNPDSTDLLEIHEGRGVLHNCLPLRRLHGITGLGHAAECELADADVWRFCSIGPWRAVILQIRLHTGYLTDDPERIKAPAISSQWIGVIRPSSTATADTRALRSTRCRRRYVWTSVSAAAAWTARIGPP